MIENSANQQAQPKKKKVSRRRHRKLWVSLISLVIIAGVGAGAFLTNGFGLIQQQSLAESSEYTSLSLTTGTLSSSITGAGSISMNDTASISLPAELTVDEVKVSAGERVAAGDTVLTLDKDSIQTKLDTLNTELSTLNSELSGYSGDTASSTITATVKGRVKQILAHKDDDVQTIMDTYGALMILSVDGYMKVEIAVPEIGLALNQTVNVVASDGDVVEGSVYSISGGTATILVDDSKLDMDESVTVKDSDGRVLGEGTAQINHPLRVTGTVGTVKSISYSVNKAVSKGATLFTLKNLPISSDYSAKLQEREECLDDIEQMKAYLESPVITATRDGIISTMELSAGATIAEDQKITLTVPETVTTTVSVDELDILSVEVGMQAEVTLDALEDETFTGVITKISAQGTTSSNVTTYPVTIQLDGDDRFLPGMSLSAEIVVKISENALLVPVSALNTSRGQTFVYVESDQALGGEPGVRTAVTTGLSDDEYAEVLSGLSASDRVVVVKSAVSSSSSQQTDTMMMGGMMDLTGGGTVPSGGGTVPSGGGTVPSGGGERPSGGGAPSGGN